jgi:hypothetical protein
MSAAQAPDPEALEGALVQAELELDDIAADAGEQLEAASAASEEGVVGSQAQIGSAVDQLGSESVGGIDAGAQATTTSLDDFKSRTTDTFQQLVDTHRQGVGQSTQASQDGFKDVGEGIDTRFEQMGQSLDQTFESGAQGLQGGLRGALKDESKDIDKHAKTAADAVKPRWKKALKILLIVAVIVVVCVLAGPLAAGLGAIGLSGMGAAVVAGVILGAAAGATIQMGNNLVDGQELMAGVGKAAIMGAIGGAFGGLGAGLASGLSSTVGRIGLEFGIDMLGGLLGELAVGNSPTLGGILLGAGIGAGVGVGMKGFSAAKLRLSPDVTVNPKIDVGAPKMDVAGPKVDAPAPKVDASAPKLDGPTAPRPEAAPVTKADAPQPTARRVQGEAPAPRKSGDTAGSTKAKSRRSGKNSPEAKAQQTAEARARIEAKFGRDGAEAFDVLAKRTSPSQAEATLRRADDLEIGGEVQSMIRSGKLDGDSLRGLNKKLKTSQDEVMSSIQADRYTEMGPAIRGSGTRNEILDAASRAARGNDVSIGGRTVEGPGAPKGKADIVDYTSREAVQMKTVTGKDNAAVLRNLDSATKQLGGDIPSGGTKGAEIPPEGFRRVADIRIGETSSLSGASRAEVLTALSGKVNNLDNLDSVLGKHGQSVKPDQPGVVRVDTGHPDGPFSFSAAELRGGSLRSAVDGHGGTARRYPEMADKVAGPTAKTPTTAKTDVGNLTAAQKALAPGTEIPLPPRTFLEKAGVRKSVGKVVRVEGDQVFVEVNGKVEAMSRPGLLQKMGVDSRQTGKQPELDGKYSGDQTTYEKFPGRAFNSAEPSPQGVQQGSLGDCWYMASMGAAARQKPGMLRRLVQDNGNGTYDVTIFLRDKTGTLVPSTKTVEMSLPTTNKSTPLYAKNGEQDGWWGALLEKRLAMETGSYGEIQGGQIGDHIRFGGGTELLTGNKTTYLRTNSMGDDVMLRHLRTSLDEGRAIVASTHAKTGLDADFIAEWEAKGLYFNHAYSLKDIDVQAGKVTLDNPHGPHTRDVVLDIAEFNEVYSGLNVEKQ